MTSRVNTTLYERASGLRAAGSGLKAGAAPEVVAVAAAGTAVEAVVVVVPGAGTEAEADADAWAVEGHALCSSAMKAASRSDGEELGMALRQGATGSMGGGRKGR